MMTPEERTAHQARLKQGLKAEIKPGILYPDSARVVVPGGARIVVIGHDADKWAQIVCGGLRLLGAIECATEDGEYIAPEDEAQQ